MRMLVRRWTRGEVGSSGYSPRQQYSFVNTLSIFRWVVSSQALGSGRIEENIIWIRP
jgi:hypothetical protein